MIAERRTMPALTLLVLACASACGGGEAGNSDGGADVNPLMRPSAFDETAPEEYRAAFQTSEGRFVVAVHRAWAPRGADRFYNLVKSGFYDDIRFFRVIDDFMAQAGMNGDPMIQAQWGAATIEDDPVTQSNTRGRVTFAMTGQPNSRSTQFFINYRDNSNLDELGFAPFGEVVEGMEVVDALYSGYGEGAPRGSGPFQNNIRAAGNEYLDADFPKLSRVVHATIE